MTSTDLVPIAQQSSFDLLPQAHELARHVAKTEFVPTTLRNRPEAVMACVLAGHEIGVGPMQSLQKIHVIEGRPAMAAELMRALILAAGHDVWFEEKSSTRVTICGQRAGSDRVSRVTWTMDDAQRAGLSGRQNYRKFPRQMLTARVTAELARDVFADVIGGFAAIEEMEDGTLDVDPGPQEGPAGEAQPVRRARRATKRAAPAKAAAAPAAGPPPPPPLPIEIDQADVIDAEVVEAEPDRGITERDIIDAAGRAFAVQYAEAPRGKKSLTIDRLRHAATYVATRGAAASLKDVDPAAMPKVLTLLEQIQEGKVTVDADPLDDTAGATFTLRRPGHQDGDKTETVLWGEFEYPETSQ